MRRRGETAAIAGLVALSTVAILLATLHQAGSSLAHGWTWTITSGDAATAELIQNLLLFVPLGASLTLAGVRPALAIAIGALLSFSVEFAQQYIPGRDPSVGDIVCNTASTAIGVALTRTAPRWLLTTPQRAARQAVAAAIGVVLIWLATGLLVRPTVPPPPYHIAVRPDFNYFGRYQGQVLGASLPNPGRDSLDITATNPPAPAGRTSPLAAVLDARDTRALLLSADGGALVVRYHMPALTLRFESLDLRWRGALEGLAPGDTFTVATWRRGNDTCIRMNSTTKCGLGYTVGDGWKLIFYPERWRAWKLDVLNVLWVAGLVVLVGLWSGMAANEAAANEAAAKGRRWVGAAAAIAIVLLGLWLIPAATGLKPTPVIEWVGAIGGILAGWTLSRVLKSRSLRRDDSVHRSVERHDI